MSASQILETPWITVRQPFLSGRVSPTFPNESHQQLLTECFVQQGDTNMPLPSNVLEMMRNYVEESASKTTETPPPLSLVFNWSHVALHNVAYGCRRQGGSFGASRPSRCPRTDWTWWPKTPSAGVSPMPSPAQTAARRPRQKRWDCTVCSANKVTSSTCPAFIPFKSKYNNVDKDRCRKASTPAGLIEIN